MVASVYCYGYYYHVQNLRLAAAGYWHSLAHPRIYAIRGDHYTVQRNACVCKTVTTPSLRTLRSLGQTDDGTLWAWGSDHDHALLSWRSGNNNIIIVAETGEARVFLASQTAVVL